MSEIISSPPPLQPKLVQETDETLVEGTETKKNEEIEKNTETEKKKNCSLNLKESPTFKKFLNIRRRFKSFFLRLFFMAIPSFHIYFVACIFNQPLFYLLFGFYVITLIDAFYVTFKRAGYDHYWFSPTFAAYTISMSLIIVFEMDFKYQKEDMSCETNLTQLNHIPECGNGSQSGISICTLVEIIVVGFLCSLVIGRWVMIPSKRMDKEAIYIQVAGFTTLSADVLEIAQYMQNEEVAKSKMLLRACQIMFGISLSQFCFSLGAVKQRNMSLSGFRRVVDLVLSTEAWSLVLALVSQELPCFILRLLLLISIFEHQDFSLYFFLLKNFLMSLLLVYRVCVLTWRKLKSERI